MKPIEFAIVGAGWRAEFFLRIARALPERFKVVGMAVRNADKGKVIEAGCGIPTWRDVDGLLAKTKPAFVLVSVLQPIAPGLIAELAGGILETKKIGDLAHEYGVAMAIHMAESPIAAMAAAHVAVARELHGARVPLSRR